MSLNFYFYELKSEISENQKYWHQKCQYLHQNLYIIVNILNCSNRYPRADTGDPQGF